MKNYNPLNDGTVSSYIIRFILSAFMGLCIEVLTATILFQFLPVIPIINYWWLCCLFPAVVGIYGIFKFDSIKTLYEAVINIFFKTFNNFPHY
jgi:hypothetical protein